MQPHSYIKTRKLAVEEYPTSIAKFKKSIERHEPSLKQTKAWKGETAYLEAFAASYEVPPRYTNGEAEFKMIQCGNPNIVDSRFSAWWDSNFKASKLWSVIMTDHNMNPKLKTAMNLSQTLVTDDERLLSADWIIRMTDFEYPRATSYRKEVYDAMVASPHQLDHVNFCDHQIVLKSTVLLSNRIGAVCTQCSAIYVSVTDQRHPPSLCAQHKAYKGYADDVDDQGKLTCHLCR